jgi:hypothetical protein
LHFAAKRLHRTAQGFSPGLWVRFAVRRPDEQSPNGTMDKTLRAVICGSRLFNTVFGLPRNAENITRSLGTCQSGSPPSLATSILPPEQKTCVLQQSAPATRRSRGGEGSRTLCLHFRGTLRNYFLLGEWYLSKSQEVAQLIRKHLAMTHTVHTPHQGIAFEESMSLWAGG